jgi:preprotein translocase subunit SecA
MFKFFKSFLDFNSREIARLKLSVAKINELGPTMAALTDDEMRVYTTKLQTKVQKEGVKLDDVLPEAFALVREASHRTLGQKHFDTQLIAGIALNEGRIAEQ